MQTVGLDLANRSVKVVSSSAQDKYVNRLYRFNGTEIFLDSLGQSTNGDTVYEYNGEKYMIDARGTTSSGRDLSRYSSEEYLVESLIAISRVALQRDIYLVAALPCEDYEEEGVAQMLIDNLKSGPEPYRLFINGKEKQINIVDVSVVPQPLGTLVDFIFNGSFSSNLDDLKYRYVIVDIGQGTTDIIATNGLRIDKIYGRPVGCLNLMDTYLNLIKKNPIIKDNIHYRIVAEDFPNHLTPIVEKYGLKFDFSQELHEAKKIVASQIRTVIRDSGIDFTLYDRVIYTGGGSLALKDYLDLIPNIRVVYPHAEMGNAKGFHKYGLIQKG